MKLLVILLALLLFGQTQAGQLENIEAICSDKQALKQVIKKHNLDRKQVEKICNQVKTPFPYAPDYESASDIADLIELLETLGMERNFVMEDVRIAFAHGISPMITEGSLPLNKLFKGKVWECIKHNAFSSNISDGSIGWEQHRLRFTVARARVMDSDGFSYGYRNGLEFIGNTKDIDFVRSVRYEYFCDEYPNCDKDNSESVTLIIEESKKGEGLLSYLSRFLNGVDAEDAAIALLRNKAARALNRRTYNMCEKTNWLTGCELAVKYYECFDNPQDFADARDGLTL